MHPDILRLHATVEAEHWWFVARREIVKAVLEGVVPDTGPLRLLDLGCGTGGNIGDLPARYSAIGVELDADAVDFARKTYPRCEFICASVYEPQTWHLDQPVDVCLLMDVLEHLEDDRAAVQNAIEALRPGGHLLVTVPANPQLWSRHDRQHQHFRRYTAPALAQLLARKETTPVLLSYFNTRLYPLVRVSRWLQERIPSWKESGTTGDLSMPLRPVNLLLKRIFAGETSRLLATLAGIRRPYHRGVSLLAVYRREAPL